MIQYTTPELNMQVHMQNIYDLFIFSIVNPPCNHLPFVIHFFSVCNICDFFIRRCSMASASKDLTTGSPAKLILNFALPMMLGSVFQQLYTITDAAIVGQFVGVEALAAVGAADWFNWLVLGIIVGFAQGFSIIPAQRFGAKRMDAMRKSAAAGILLTGVLGVLLTAVSLPLIRPILRLMDTEASIFADAAAYLTILFSGIVVVAGYNIFSSLLRSMGNSRDPLIAMIIGAVVNIALDLLFVVVFHWGVAGAAFATVIGQSCALLYSLFRLLREKEMKFQSGDWKPEGSLITRELALGAPMALQNAVIGVGGMALQQVVNGFGYVFVAGFTATNKLYGLLELAAINFGYAVASFSGQNLGAGQFDRVKKGVRTAAIMGVITSIAVGVVMIVLGRWVVSAFISAEDPVVAEQAIGVAYDFLVTMCVPLFILYLLHIYRSALQGMGDTVMPFVSGIFELVMRLSIAHIAPPFIGEFGLYLAEPMAWLGADLVLLPSFFHRIRRLDRQSQ